MKDPKVDPKLNEILEELVSCACSNCIVGVSLYATQHTAQALLEWAEGFCKKARIDELGSVQLEYGHYLAQTFVNGQAMTIMERIADLEAKEKKKQKE